MCLNLQIEKVICGLFRCERELELPLSVRFMLCRFNGSQFPRIGFAFQLAIYSRLLHRGLVRRDSVGNNTGVGDASGIFIRLGSTVGILSLLSFLSLDPPEDFGLEFHFGLVFYLRLFSIIGVAWWCGLHQSALSYFLLLLHPHF